MKNKTFKPRRMAETLSIPARDTRLFFLLIVMCAGFIVAAIFTPRIERLVMSKFHLRTTPAGLWYILQLVPSMGNFTGELWVMEGPLNMKALEDPVFQPNALFYQKVSDYPLKVLISDPAQRGAWAEKEKFFRIALRTTYQGRSMVTVYDMESQPPELLLGVRYYGKY